MKQFFVVILIFSLLSNSCSEKHYTNALSPEEALSSFELNKDFTIELFAAEPFVMDPVEMVFDEQGNAFVVEMADFPFRPESGIGTGRIRMLSDTNGDGRIDKSIIFADSLLEATSILPWGGGLIVTAAPNIYYLKDTNGDNKADTKELLFSGFFTNNPEAQITNLRLSVDNWIYAANFGQEGKVTSGRNPGADTLSMAGADFRFRLDRGKFELETAPAQFGQTINDWGIRFITDNSTHIQQPVIPWRYLHRHPYMPPIEATVNISDHDPIMYQITTAPYWRAERTKRRNKTYKENKLDREEYADGHFTGACGTTVYAANAFPKKYYGNIFTGDVAGNLVHRDVVGLDVDSVVYVAKRDDDEKNKEFLTSTDPWFRPVNFTLGPDGALYVIDMYRQHIEAPPFIPEDLKADMNFSNGKQMGRIYRIVPKDLQYVDHKIPHLKDATAAELVEVLSNPNQWWRLQAQRLLIERQDISIVPALKTLLTTHPDPRTRLHALYTLEGLNALDEKLVEQAMNDAYPELRKSAIILSESYKNCLPKVIKCIDDSSAIVALQATLSVGQFSSPQVSAALAKAIEKHGKNSWFSIAVLSSEAGSSPQLLELLTKQHFFSDTSAGTLFLKKFSYVVGYRSKHDEIVRLLELINAPEMKIGRERQLAALTGLKDGIKKSENKIKIDASFRVAANNLKTGAPKEILDAINEIEILLE